MSECPNCGEERLTVVSLPGCEGAFDDVREFVSVFECEQCHTVVRESWTPAACAVCLKRMWRELRTLANGQRVHSFCLDGAGGGQ